MCSTNDIEICERGIDKISSVDEFNLGEPHIMIELYEDEARFAYYYCRVCQVSWSNQDYKTQELAWEKVKEHLNV